MFEFLQSSKMYLFSYPKSIFKEGEFEAQFKISTTFQLLYNSLLYNNTVKIRFKYVEVAKEKRKEKNTDGGT